MRYKVLPITKGHGTKEVLVAMMNNRGSAFPVLVWAWVYTTNGYSYFEEEIDFDNEIMSERYIKDFSKESAEAFIKEYSNRD